MKESMTDKKPMKTRIRKYLHDVFAHRYLYLMILPAAFYLIMIEYKSMYGIVLAFKDFNARLGIMGSPWVGFKHFKSMLTDPYFLFVLRNTIYISFTKIIFCFPWAIIIALGFSELKQRHFKKVLQTVYTFPHFLSWVIVSGVVVNFLSYVGPLNSVLSSLGLERHIFLGDKKMIIPILYITDVWKGSGWNSIIYMAAITAIDQGLYEAAELDGASRWQKMWHITLPCIRGTILVMLTLRVGHILNAGFEQIFNLSNMVTQKTTDIIDTYVYRITFQQAPDFAYSTAVGLFKILVGLALVLTVNKISRKLEGTGVFE